jgi:hypothetical protein
MNNTAPIIGGLGSNLGQQTTYIPKSQAVTIEGPYQKPKKILIATTNIASALA